MTPMSLLSLRRLADQLPELAPEDRDHVMAHAVILEECGITGDASKERGILERLIVRYAQRIAYCRYVEQQLAKKKKPVSYGEWASSPAEPKSTH